MAFEEQLPFVEVAFITEGDLKHHLRKGHFPIKLRGSHIINSSERKIHSACERPNVL